MKIQVEKSVLAGFRRRALKRYPNEYMETVWGRIANDVVQIHAFYPVDHKADTEHCQYETADIEEQKSHDDGPALPQLKYLGTIHSHPDGGKEPSEADWITAREDGDVVSGIYQILPQANGRKKGKVRFYSEPLQQLEIT